MSDGTVLWIAGVVVGGVFIFLFLMLGKSIIDERRRSRLRRTWSNFGLSISRTFLSGSRSLACAPRSER
ncbi:MAG: hypothetical protein ACXWF5_13310, partial [Actinomycetota bacterium]